MACDLMNRSCTSTSEMTQRLVQELSEYYDVVDKSMYDLYIDFSYETISSNLREIVRCHRDLLKSETDVETLVDALYFIAAVDATKIKNKIRQSCGIEYDSQVVRQIFAGIMTAMRRRVMIRHMLKCCNDDSYQIIVDGSTFGRCDNRKFADRAVYELDRDYFRSQAEIAVSGLVQSVFYDDNCVCPVDDNLILKDAASLVQLFVSKFLVDDLTFEMELYGSNCAVSDVCKWVSQIDEAGLIFGLETSKVYDTYLRAVSYTIDAEPLTKQELYAIVRDLGYESKKVNASMTNYQSAYVDHTSDLFNDELIYGSKSAKSEHDEILNRGSVQLYVWVKNV